MTISELKEYALQQLVELRKSPDLRDAETKLRQATNDFMLACLAAECGWPNVVEEVEE